MSHSLHALGSSLQAMPVAMVFSKQLMLTQKSSVARAVRSDDMPKDPYTIRATKMTVILKEIRGYSHGGLNE